jgi:heme oxygenase
MVSVNTTGLEALKIELSQMGLAHPDETVLREFVERDQTFVRELNALYTHRDRDRYLSEASRTRFFDLIGHHYARDRWPTAADPTEHTTAFLATLTRAMKADGWLMVEEGETATTH